MVDEFNQEIAENLRQIAELLEQQEANPFRIRAYRQAANTIETIPQSVKSIVAKKDFQGLLDLPAIGPGIARSIYEYVATGRMTRLESLRGASDPALLFQHIPVLGLKLARRICEELHIDSLESLENAVISGRLAKIPGMGEKRVEVVKAWLQMTLGKRHHQVQIKQSPSYEPEVELLLKLDHMYRQKADADMLPKISPHRFNPQDEAWLPILHSQVGEWHASVVYSNTELAHKLKRTRDWVVIYFYDNQHHEGQNTVVTETRGPLIGKRVVRGREIECRRYYQLN